MKSSSELNIKFTFNSITNGYNHLNRLQIFSSETIIAKSSMINDFHLKTSTIKSMSFQISILNRITILLHFNRSVLFLFQFLPDKKTSLT